MFYNTRLLFLIFTSLLGVVSCSFKSKKDKVNKINEEKTNFIVIFVDDLGYGDIGCFGAKGFKTPNIDQMAKEGARFTDFYVPASVCTPSRAGLLTGSYPKRVGLHKEVLYPYSTSGLNPNEIIIPEVLKPAGYTTGCIGKWHLGHQEKFMPNNQGFDYFYGVPYSNDMDGHVYVNIPFTSPPLPIYKNKVKVAEGINQDSLTIRWTKAATSFIKENKKQPFFLYLAHNMPHRPWHVSKRYKGSSEKGLYGDVIQELDWSVGEILKTLKETNLDENTLVIFTSDNGPVETLKNGGSAEPLRGGKISTWEGGLRVPCIMRWPGKIKPNKEINQITSVMDFLPTFASIAQVKVPISHKIDGYNISNILLEDKKTVSPYNAFYFYGRNGDLEGIREGNWKFYIKKYNMRKKTYTNHMNLYNLKNDVGEKQNIADMHPEIVEKLHQKMLKFDKQLSIEARPIGH
ncbi:hypothetical protein APS56_04595 [Pseudalgibacter alginicilyticus]|uniref:Sulfatase N-terminal domain-containing protein n=1 Tax=Pseudalgibacter alginicilyticus TaxID=1736674 RepID=A0A0N7HY74_9FLAO|nr:sulfatase [Pseudalgibacter alginicilyticus]ALJ04462.1 hypothetical protein APS56_04595 [Pseudalgibacter alginicilyticus]